MEGPIPLYVYIENFNKQNARYSHQTSQTCCCTITRATFSPKDTTLYCTLIKWHPFKDFEKHRHGHSFHTIEAIFIKLHTFVLHHKGNILNKEWILNKLSPFTSLEKHRCDHNVYTIEAFFHKSSQTLLQKHKGYI